jgi:hypothetical protein
MHEAQAAFLGNAFWWTWVSVILALLLRSLEPSDAG